MSSSIVARIDPFPTITSCNRLPFGPALTAEPTSHRAGAPTGLDMTLTLPASDGVEVLEPAQMRDLRIDLPVGLATNTDSADGLGTCSAEQVNFGERVDAECPNAAKLADTEFEIPVLSRRMKGAIYLREPEPGDPFRIWVVADDLGAHVKLSLKLRDGLAMTVELPRAEIDSLRIAEGDFVMADLRQAKVFVEDYSI